MNLIPPTKPTQIPPRGTLRVLFTRGRHRWAFECDRAGEPELLRWIAWCAENPGCKLDRADAALIARQFVTRNPAPALNPDAREADLT